MDVSKFNIDKIIKEYLRNNITDVLNSYSDECKIHNNHTPADAIISNIIVGGGKCTCKKRYITENIIDDNVVNNDVVDIKYPINSETTMEQIRGYNLFYKIQAQIGKADFGMIKQKNNNCYWRCVIHMIMKMLNEENILEKLNKYIPKNSKTYNNSQHIISEEDKNLAYNHIKLMLYLKHMGQVGVDMENTFWDGNKDKKINELYCDLPIGWSGAMIPCVDFGVSPMLVNTLMGSMGDIVLQDKKIIPGDKLAFVDSSIDTHKDKIQTQSRKRENKTVIDPIEIYNSMGNIKQSANSTIVGITLPYEQNGTDLQSYLGIGSSVYNKTANTTDGKRLETGENCNKNPEKCDATIEIVKYKLNDDAKYLIIDSGRVEYDMMTGQVICKNKQIHLNDMIYYDDCVLVCVSAFLHHGVHYTTIVRDGKGWKYYHDSNIESPNENVSDNIITMNNLHGDKLSNKWITALYKIVKRNVTVVALDFDGVLHKNVGEIDSDGYRHTISGPHENVFRETINFIKTVINKDDVFLYILSHNPLCHTNAFDLLTSEGIDLSIPVDVDTALNPKKIEYKCLPYNLSKKHVDKTEELLKIGARIFIDDSPTIINTCIKGNCINYLHSEMVLYYALPQHDKYIKIDKLNKCLLKVNPILPNSLTTLTSEYSLLTYNVCWECMSGTGNRGSAAAYGAKCSKHNTDKGTACRKNVIHLCGLQKYAFIAIQEGEDYLASQIIEQLHLNGHTQYEKLVWIDGVSSSILLYNKDMFNVEGNMSHGNIVRNSGGAERGRPYLAQIFRDVNSKELIGVMTLHGPHSSYSIRANVKTAFEKIDNHDNISKLIIMGDFNKQNSNNFKITVGSKTFDMLPLNRNYNTCCKLNPTGLPRSYDYSNSYDNIIVSNNVTPTHIEYLNDTQNVMFPNNNTHTFNYTNNTSDHLPIAAKVSYNTVLSTPTPLSDDDLLSVYVESTPTNPINTEYLSVVNTISL